jgi:hypothetical protein
MSINRALEDGKWLAFCKIVSRLLGFVLHVELHHLDAIESGQGHFFGSRFSRACFSPASSPALNDFPMEIP